MKNLTSNAFIAAYIASAVEQLSLIYPKLPKNYLTAFVTKKAVEKCKDVPVIIKNTYTDEKEYSTLLNVLDFIYAEKPIIAGNGSFYIQHTMQVAPANIMLIESGEKRKEMKKEMFKYEGVNPSEYIRYSLGQNNVKIFRNAYYGAMGESRSFQYNESTAGAITAQGRHIISATTWFGEMFLGNNLAFTTLDEIVSYMAMIMNEENRLEYYTYIDYIPSVTEITGYYVSKYEGREDLGYVAAVVDKIAFHATDSQKIKLFYKNNLYVCIEKNPKIKDFLMQHIIPKVCSYSHMYNIPSELQDPMHIFKEIILEFVLLPAYIMYNKFLKYKTHTRKIVAYSDTDSVFNYMGQWLFTILQYEKGIAISDIVLSEIPTNFALGVCNVIGYLNSIGTRLLYDAMLNIININDDYKKYIDAKNEFLIDRYISYTVKKNYIFRIIVHEGNILKTPKLEVKGGNLNSKSKNGEVISMIQKTVHEVTMEHDKIRPELLVQRIYDLKNIIVESLNKGESRFLLPTKIKAPDAYETPFSMHTIRAIEVYRIISEDEAITLPSIYNIIDVQNMNSITDLSYLKEHFPLQYERFKTGVFAHKQLKGSITYIAIPLYLESIPAWIMPYINIHLIWRKHLNPLISLCPAIGIKIDTIKSKNYHSTALAL